MIKKRVRLALVAVLAVMLAFSVWGFAANVFAADAVDPVAPFYNNPNVPDCGTVEKNADGSFKIAQKYGGGDARTFYGDYTRGSTENAYFMDLTDATITLSVDELAAGVGIEIYFVSYVQNGSYPMHPYGQGFSLRLNDDGAGNTGFTPVVHTYSFDTGYTPKNYNGNDYLVYNNAPTGRTSYLGKEMKIHIYKEGDNLNVYADWVRDEINAETAYDFRATIPLADLPSTGGTPFDYTNAQFGISSNGSDPMALTISDISDAKTNAYYNGFGGKYKNSLAYTKNYAEAVAAFDKDAVTAQQVKDYYGAKLNFDGLNANNMRKNDRYEYEQANELSVAGFDDAALAIKDQVFAGYSADGEITDKEDAIAVFAFYTAFSDQLSEYDAVAEHIRATLAQEDMGQKAIESTIDALIAKYSGTAVKRENYKAALAEYNAAVSQYNSLSAVVRTLVNNFDELETWKEETLTQMKALYYSTQGTYFTNQWGVEGQEDSQTIMQSVAGAVRNDDGTTKLILTDDTSLRLVYGTDIQEGKWTDYSIDLSNFEMTFSIDQLTSSGRFAINFVSQRGALPYGDETAPGLSIVLRNEGSSIWAALTETKGGLYPTQNDNSGYKDYWSGKLDAWGGFGRLTAASVLNTNITLRLQETETGITLSLAVDGGNTISVELPAEYIDYLFTTEEGAIDTAHLAMNFTVGEGMQSFNGGQDIELTVKSIKDAYYRQIADLNTAFSNYKNIVETLSAQTSLTYNEIANYNSEKDTLDNLSKGLRTYEAEEFAEKMATIDQAKTEKIDQMAADYMKAAIEAIADVTVENYAAAETKLNSLVAEWDKFTAAQKALYATFEDDVAAIRADVAGCSAAKAVIDDIAALIVKNPLPATIDALRAEYAAAEEKYNALADEYRALVSNHDDFVAYGEKLDAYDPAKSVTEAIEKLFEDYDPISSANKAEAKAAVQAVKDAYDELTEGQQAEVENYGRIAEFEQKIADFEQSQVDYAKAAAFDKKVKSVTDGFATVQADNREAAEAAVDALIAEFGELTEAQQALVENYALIEALQGKIDAYDADVAAKAAADAVIAKINAIGTVENTAESKAKIDEARAAYDALDSAAKAKVTNLSVLEKAEADYAAMQQTKPSKKGCGSSVSAVSVLIAVLATGCVLLLLRSKKKI